MADKKDVRQVDYRLMCILAMIVGGGGITLQFFPGWEFFSFFLSVAVLGGLIGGSSGYDEQDRRLLQQSYKTAFEWLLLVVMAAYAFNELSKGLAVIGGAANFLNSHWPGLVISVMCALMGIAGVQKKSKNSRT